MPRKNIYIIIIAAIIIFLGLIAFLVLSGTFGKKNVEVNPGNQQGNPTVTTGTSTAGVVPAGLSQDDALALAKKNKDPLPCFKITKGGNAQLCVELLAQFLQDGNVCADITDAEVKASCVGRAVFEKAVSGGDLALCAQISDATLDQACLQKIIDAKKFTAADCVALPDKEKNYCTGYLAYLADNALFASAKSKSDCQKISDSTIKQFCLDKQL